MTSQNGENSSGQVRTDQDRSGQIGTGQDMPIQDKLKD